jgi:hypothetical protein
MATARDKQKSPTASENRLDRMSGEYERGHGAPFSPDSPEVTGNSPAVVEADRRAADSGSPAKVAGAAPSDVKAPKAPEHTRGKQAAARRAAPRTR